MSANEKRPHRPAGIVISLRQDKPGEAVVTTKVIGSNVTRVARAKAKPKPKA